MHDKSYSSVIFMNTMHKQQCNYGGGNDKPIMMWNSEFRTTVPGVMTTVFVHCTDQLPGPADRNPASLK